MTQILAIAAGGSIGAVMRYLVSTGVYSYLGRGFPYGTLVVNVLGSLLMGLLYELFLQRLAMSAELRAMLLVGFLGAFTTFSTFSIETINLIEQGYLLKAVGNILASVILCVLAAWLGLQLARQL
ncbi:camphor resistance protein CrcB [Cycloclasticus sp. 46_120_T64]|nr:camphor resistance protein CrcB [Cycloclasticus sp. 46_120_T64]